MSFYNNSVTDGRASHFCKFPGHKDVLIAAYPVC